MVSPKSESDIYYCGFGWLCNFIGYMLQCLRTAKIKLQGFPNLDINHVHLLCINILLYGMLQELVDLFMCLFLCEIIFCTKSHPS